MLSILCPGHLFDIRRLGLIGSFQMATSYPISAVAKLTGIPLDTLRAWERRYRTVIPKRAARGRVYSEEQIQKLLLLRRAVEQGHSIGQVAALGERQLRELLEKSSSLAAGQSAAKATIRVTSWRRFCTHSTASTMPGPTVKSTVWQQPWEARELSFIKPRCP
jgi:DNA-binding transcriptional MerR regulator